MSSRNIAKPAKRTQPGRFSLLFSSENHPGLAISGCFAIFCDCSATPPCGDARRGLALDFDFIHTFVIAERFTLAVDSLHRVPDPTSTHPPRV